MPGVNKPVQMAECLNCGLADNDDLRQAFMQPAPIFADMFLRSLQDWKRFDCNSHNSLNDEGKELIRKLMTSPSPNEISNSASEAHEVTVPEKESDSYICENDINSAVEGNVLESEKVPSNESLMYFLPVNYNKRNPWRRIIGLLISAHEIISATYPARSSVKKLRFAQAKKPLNYLYSYFSVELLHCDEQSSITIGLSRKDYPSKVAPGKLAGSIGYCSDSGCVFMRDAVQLDGLRFSEGDVIGCGIIYPSWYKHYADLSTDDNSDGMTDVVLTSLLNINTKSMDFVCNALNLNTEVIDTSSDFESSCSDARKTDTDECDYYNENFVESRTQVEVYFTHNMQVVGKVLSHIPVGGFYPTIHVFSTSAVKMSVDLNPPSS